MYLILLGAAAALTLTGAAVWRLYRLQNLIRMERAEARLLRGVDHRDMDAFRTRIEGLLSEHQAAANADRVVAEAVAIVAAELARTPHYPHEGDPT